MVMYFLNSIYKKLVHQLQELLVVIVQLLLQQVIKPLTVLRMVILILKQQSMLKRSLIESHLLIVHICNAKYQTAEKIMSDYMKIIKAHVSAYVNAGNDAEKSSRK